MLTLNFEYSKIWAFSSKNQAEVGEEGNKERGQGREKKGKNE